MIQKPKGTYDVIDGEKILYIENVWKTVMEKHNVQYFRTPIFESSELFTRGVGETSDIVTKEMYTFNDKGNRSLTLRPEGTAGIVRSFIENKLYATSLPLKAWYYGSMYRYERPQAGRFREFYQMGVEAFGSEDPVMDVEIIQTALDFYKHLGVLDLKLKINTLGDDESRNLYRQVLVDYFTDYSHELCGDCLNRLDKNPLRILDCKVDNGKDLFNNAPKMKDFLNDISSEHFDKVLTYLNALHIDYEIDDNLVRGLDYYTHTVFEIVGVINNSELTLCAGGRYNKLVEELGGPSVPGVGFALGVERLLEVLDFKVEKSIDAYIVYMDDTAKIEALKLSEQLRNDGFITDMDYMNKNMKSNFKQADKLGAKFVIIIGEEELENKIYTVKNNSTKEEFKIEFNYINYFLQESGEVEESFDF